MNIIKLFALTLLINISVQQTHAQQVVLLQKPSSSFLSIPTPITCIFLLVLARYGKTLWEAAPHYFKYQAACDKGAPQANVMRDRANGVNLQDVIAQNWQQLASLLLPHSPIKLVDKSTDISTKLDIAGQYLGKFMLFFIFNSWKNLIIAPGLIAFPAFKRTIALYLQARDAAATGASAPAAVEEVD